MAVFPQNVQTRWHDTLEGRKKRNLGQSLVFVLSAPLQVFGGLRKEADTITVLAVSWN